MDILALTKKKGKIIVIKKTEEFEDTYNLVHVSGKWLNSLGLDTGCITKSHRLYPEFLEYFKLVNIFNDRIEVPNKKIKTDRDGTSKLIRHPKDDSIEIARRQRRKEGFEETASSPNTCFITNADREKFFRDVKQYGKIIPGKVGSRYFLFPQSPTYSFWSKLMDNEYIRLSGIDFKKKRKQTIIEPKTIKEAEYYKDYKNLINHLFCEIPASLELNIFCEAAENGLCKISKNKEAIYDKDGIFLQMTCFPIETEAFNKILNKLEISEIRVLKTILNQYLL